MPKQVYSAMSSSQAGASNLASHRASIRNRKAHAAQFCMRTFFRQMSLDLQYAACSVCVHVSTMPTNQCGAVAARVAARAFVRWQSETRIKVQPLCHNGNGNIES